MSDKRDWRKSSQGERLRWALQYSPRAVSSPDGKVRQNELARAVGIKPSSLNQVLSGLTNSMTAENTESAAIYLKVSYRWLASGKGQPEDTGIQRIPVTIRISRVGNIMAINPVEGGGYIRMNSDDPDAYACSPDDNSYAPIIKAGRILLVEPNHEIVSGMPVLLRLKNNPPDIAEFKRETPFHRIYESYQYGFIGDLRVLKDDIAAEHYIKAVLSDLAVLT